jgi:T3SS (YopN, CesT) and YbjN peptide-binding chaperone 3/SseB protein N-terminal domain
VTAYPQTIIVFGWQTVERGLNHVEWNEFVQRLARELTHLPASAFLVVQMPGGFPYVQAMRGSDGLSAEVVSNEFLPGPMRLGPRQEDRLAEIGWLPPEQDGHLNWWRQVRLSAEFDDFTPQEAIACGRLADAMATALSEVFRVRSPLDLEYHANQNGPDNGPIELPYFGLRPAEIASADEDDRPTVTDSPVVTPSAAAASASAPSVPASSVPAPSVPAPSVPAPLVPSVTGASTAPSSSVAAAAVGISGPRTPPHPGRLRQAPPEPAAPTRAAVPSGGEAVPSAAEAVPSAAELDALLAAAKERGDQRSYFELLLTAELVMPSTGDPKAERFTTATLDGATYVLAFTSRRAMAQSLRARAAFDRRTTFAELARNWPGPEWRLAINAGLPSAAYLDSAGVTRLADEERAAGRSQATAAVPPAPARTPTSATGHRPHRQKPVAEPAAEPAPQHEPPPHETGPTIMQKVIPHQHVSHYLESAYDQVAGYVHRVQDVQRYDTPERLVRGLGLTYEGSPFSDQDEAVHVIRWPAVKGSLYRAPYGGQDEATMRRVPEGWVIEKPPFLGTGYAPGEGEGVPEFKTDSQRLPHGAQMYRLDQSGARTFVAFFDADHRRWIKVRRA